MTALFQRYIGIDYSGAKASCSGLPGLRVFIAEGSQAPQQVTSTHTDKKHWTREGVAIWLVEVLRHKSDVVIGIDHGLSFPLAYFEQHALARNWDAFLDDFAAYWPVTGPDTTVDDIRKGLIGKGEKRMGSARWRRLTEQRSGKAKSVFHFDVQGSVAKSTHSGLGWLHYIRRQKIGSLHIWPFDGWSPPGHSSVLCEAYPALYRPEVDTPAGMTTDETDAYAIAAWLQKHDMAGTLADYFKPQLSLDQADQARLEGWILGVM